MKDKGISKGTKIKEKESSLIHKEINFSFKYLDLNDSDFSIDDCSADYFLKFIERLKNICGLSPIELIHNKSKSLRFHTIEWEKTSKKDGFCNLSSHYQDLPAYQFSISANKHGRIHGFILETVFFIVWFDPKHRVYC
jgi:hypothetical protein